MAQTGNMPQAEGVGSQLDLAALTKYSAVSGGVAYATGMLEVNIYLHQLGITDFSLAKPKLIVTGIVVLLTFLLLALFPLFVARWISLRGSLRGSKRSCEKILFLLLFPLFMLVAASSHLAFKKPGLGQIAVWKVWEILNATHQTVFNSSLTTLVIAATVYLPICIATVAAFKASRLFNDARSGTTVSDMDRVYFPVMLALAVISVIGYIYIFSLTFYPAISPAFGGGEPYLERFVVAEGQRCQWQQLGIPFVDEHSNITAPVPVLHESDTQVAVWLTDQAESWRPILVEIDKTQISAIRMVDPRAKKIQPLTSLPERCGTSSSSGAVSIGGSVSRISN